MGWEWVEGYRAGMEEDVEGLVEGKGRMWWVDQAVGVGYGKAEDGCFCLWEKDGVCVVAIFNVSAKDRADPRWQGGQVVI